MQAGDYIVIAVIALILGLVCLYLYQAKKKGKKCIGCPYSDSCSSCQCQKEQG